MKAEAVREEEIHLYSLFNFGASWGSVVYATPHRFTTGKDPVLILQTAGRAPQPVWTSAENISPTGVRTPIRPARSDFLYRLRYPGPRFSTRILYSLNIKGTIRLYLTLLECDIVTSVINSISLSLAQANKGNMSCYYSSVLQ
jgi:hypothetical protein